MRICDYCGRGPRRSASRSHSNIATKRWQYINLQRRWIKGKLRKICAKCLKTFDKRGVMELPLPGSVKFVHSVK